MIERDNYKEKTKKQKAGFIIKCIFWILGVALLLMGIVANITDIPSFFWNILRDGVGSVVSAFSALETWLPAVLRSLTWLIIIFIISKFARFLLNKILVSTNRGKTILKLFDSSIKYAGGIAAVFFMLTSWGVDTGTLLASAGIVGLIIGLGAQSIIEDVLSGISILFENAYQIGDIVVIDGFRGEILEIGIRTTKILDSMGDLRVINNSDVRSVVNMTYNLSVSIVDVSINYSEHLERVEKILNESMKGIAEKIPSIVNLPQYKGVQEFNNSGVTLRIIAECKEENRFQMTRDLRRELKIIFDNNGIEMAKPQIVVSKSEKAD